MNRLFGVVVAGLAVAGVALAGGRKEQNAPKEGGGVFISATPKAEGGALDLKMALDNEGERVFELPARVAVMYLEQNEKKLVRMIRVPGRRAPEAKGNALIAQGTLTKAELQGNRVLVTLKVGEGDKAADQQFTMASRLEIAYCDEGGKLIVQHLSAAGKPGRPEKGARLGKPNRPGKENPENQAPENF